MARESDRSFEGRSEGVVAEAPRRPLGHLDLGDQPARRTLGVAPHVRRVTGFDYAEGMIGAARRNAAGTGVENADFVHASSRELPFGPASFDLIYSRRGPTSILLRPDLLAPGGWMVGIHGARRDVIEARLASGGFAEVRLDDYRALERFPTLEDFARFWSRMPGHPDYLAPDAADALAELAREHRDEDGLVVEERRSVWRGRRPTG